VLEVAQPGAGAAAAGARPNMPRPALRLRLPRRARRPDRDNPQAFGAPATTRSGQVLNPALVGAPTGPSGVLIGRDLLSGAMVCHDPFTAYAHGIVSSPAVLAIGEVGSGKSALLKTVYVMRPLALRNRRVVVADRKDQAGQGEYAPLCRVLGTEPIRFTLAAGGAATAGAATEGSRLNVLDPLVLAGTGRAGQLALLVALAELAAGGRELDRWEHAALRAAHTATLTAAEQAGGRIPVLADLLARLGVDHPDFADHSPAAREHAERAALVVRHALAGLLADDLAGLFDGPTSPWVDLTGRLTVFDISQLPERGPATAMVLAVANAWLLGRLRTERGMATNFVAEEGWELVGGPAGRVFARNSKLARGLGLSNIAAIHHIADIPEGDPAVAVLKEAATVHLFRQSRTDDAAAAAALFGLTPAAAAALPHLPDGQHLLKIADRPEIHVAHLRAAVEVGFTDTDTAMLTGGPGTRASLR
jgi:hypothetical protein